MKFHQLIHFRRINQCIISQFLNSSHNKTGFWMNSFRKFSIRMHGYGIYTYTDYVKRGFGFGDTKLSICLDMRG